MIVRVNLLSTNGSRGEGAARRFRLTLPAVASRSKARAIVIGCLVMAVLVGVRGWRLHVRQVSLAGEIEREVADSTSLAHELERLRSVVARQEGIATRIRVGREIDGRRYVWPHLLDELSAALPEEAWLVEIVPVIPPDSAGGVAFAVQGRASSAALISEYIRELERSPFIEGVSFVHAVRESLGDRTVHRFGLEARYEIPDSAAIQVSPIQVEEGR